MSPERSWWQIPLWSPKHFAMTCTVAFMALVLAGQVVGSDKPPSAVAPSAASTSWAVAAEKPAESSSQSTAATPRPQVLASPSSSVTRISSRATGPRDAASAFVAAWARPYDRTDRWHDVLAPLSTPAFAHLIQKAEPEHVPATRSFGDPKVLKQTPRSATVRITTDAGPLRIGLRRTGGRWLVGAIEPIEEGR